MEREGRNNAPPLARASLRLQSDERLSKLFSRGVDPAFDELARRYRGSLVGFATGIVGRDRAEDVVQDALVKAHRSMSTEEIRQPRAWLYRVVRNTALNELRDGGRHEHDELEDHALRHLGDPAVSEAERREELASLITALTELPEAQRTALVGKELGGYSHDELATRLGVSTGATKQLVFRARTTLRDALGALMPLPLIAWLASNAGSTFIAAGAGGVGSSAVATASGNAAAGATGASAGGGILAGLAGGGATKVAVIVAVAGGSVAAGVAVEEQPDRDPIAPTRAAIDATAQAAVEAPALLPGAVLTSPGPTTQGKTTERKRPAVPISGEEKRARGAIRDRPSPMAPGQSKGEGAEPGLNSGLNSVPGSPPGKSRAASGPANPARPATPSPGTSAGRPAVSAADNRGKGSDTSPAGHPTGPAHGGATPARKPEKARPAAGLGKAGNAPARNGGAR